MMRRTPRSTLFPYTTLLGSGPYTYAWTGPGGFTATSQTISVNAAGTYNVTVTNSRSHHCTPGRSATWIPNANPTKGVNSPTVCASDLPSSLTAKPSGGTSPF